MKKIFYNKRHKLPIWSQIYVVWAVLFAIGIFWVLKFEVIENKNQIRNTFEYKTNQTIINDGYNSIKALYSSSQSIENKLSAIKNSMAQYNLAFEEISYNVNQSRCSMLRLSPSDNKIRLGIIFNARIDDTHLKVIHSLALSLQNQRIRDTAVALIEGNPVCNDFIIQNNLLKVENYGGLIFGYPSKKQKPSLQTAFLYGFSSIGWSGIIPSSENRPGLLEQAANIVIPYFERTYIQNNGENYNLIGWNFPEEVYNNELENINFVLPGVLFVAKNYSSIKEFKNHIWIGTDKALSLRGIRILSFLIILLIWLPVANRIYQKETLRSLFPSFFSAFFNSIILFLMVATAKIFSYFMPESVFGPVIVIGMGFSLFALFARMQKKTLNVSAGFLTEYFIFIAFASILGFINFIFLVSALPIVWIANIKPKLPAVLFRFLLLVFALPFAFFVGYLIDLNGFLPYLSLLVMDKVFFTHSLQTLVLVFMGGSLVSICRDAR